jgi:hypothetical protein
MLGEVELPSMKPTNSKLGYVLSQGTGLSLKGGLAGP